MTKSPNAHLPRIAPGTPINLMPPLTQPPDHLEHMSGTLTIVANITNIQIPEILVAATTDEDALLPETEHRILNLHPMLDL